jgi:transglutaminase-like putative cysteine protease
MPYYYDYIDYIAKDDRRNYFVTKTLATGTGQCHTFPVTYLILAEALGIDANLAYNPRHSFIRYKNKNNAVMNYETTVDRFLADAFYLQTLPIMAKAQKNKLYAFSLTKKQVVATVLYDMAANFAREHWIADKIFITECMKIAKPYFPNQEYINGTESYLNKIIYAETLNTMAKEKGITDAADIEKYPDLLKAYTNYYSYMEKVNNLGIQDFPESEELRMMEYADKKGRLQTAKKINSKEKKTLFIK